MLKNIPGFGQDALAAVKGRPRQVDQFATAHSKFAIVPVPVIAAAISF